MRKSQTRCTWAGGAVIALAALASSVAWAGPAPDGKQDAKPVVLAQVPTRVAAATSATPVGAFPAYQRGVRQAAAEGNESLRRYVWRTRMVYNFYYNDFAPKE